MKVRIWSKTHNAFWNPDGNGYTLSVSSSGLFEREEAIKIVAGSPEKDEIRELFMDEEIRALSWKQPFASLMLHGKIETRTWFTPYRGLVLICASKKSYTEKEIFNITGEEQFHHIRRVLFKQDISKGEPLGVAIAVGRLMYSRLMTPADKDAAFVQYHEDLWCHVYEDVKAIEPFSWLGTQGWKKLNEEEKRKIKIL